MLLFLNGIKMSNVQENLGDQLLAVVALSSMQSKKFPAKGWELQYLHSPNLTHQFTTTVMHESIVRVHACNFCSLKQIQAYMKQI